MRLAKPLLFMTVALLSASALASEEGALRLREFRFEALDKSGRIIVSGTQSDTGINRLRIDAFRKSFTLTPSHLEQLRGLRHPQSCSFSSTAGGAHGRVAPQLGSERQLRCG
jgi:hypothetical protein